MLIRDDSPHLICHCSFEGDAAEDELEDGVGLARVGVVAVGEAVSVGGARGETEVVPALANNVVFVKCWNFSHNAFNAG